jgi:hypothetical protein
MFSVAVTVSVTLSVLVAVAVAVAVLVDGTVAVAVLVDGTVAVDCSEYVGFFVCGALVAANVRNAVSTSSAIKSRVAMWRVDFIVTPVYQTRTRKLRSQL